MVARAGGQFLKASAVRLDDGDLRAALDTIGGLQKHFMEAVEERAKLADAENDLVAIVETIGQREYCDCFPDGRLRNVRCRWWSQQARA